MNSGVFSLFISLSHTYNNIYISAAISQSKRLIWGKMVPADTCVKLCFTILHFSLLFFPFRFISLSLLCVVSAMSLRQVVDLHL